MMEPRDVVYVQQERTRPPLQVQPRARLVPQALAPLLVQPRAAIAPMGFIPQFQDRLRASHVLLALLVPQATAQDRAMMCVLRATTVVVVAVALAHYPARLAVLEPTAATSVPPVALAAVPERTLPPLLLLSAFPARPVQHHRRDLLPVTLLPRSRHTLETGLLLMEVIPQLQHLLNSILLKVLPSTSLEICISPTRTTSESVW